MSKAEAEPEDFIGETEKEQSTRIGQKQYEMLLWIQKNFEEEDVIISKRSNKLVLEMFLFNLYNCKKCLIMQKGFKINHSVRTKQQRRSSSTNAKLWIHVHQARTHHQSLRNMMGREDFRMLALSGFSSLPSLERS